MSEELLYNRDNNYTGSFVPEFLAANGFSGVGISYGSSMQISSRANTYETDNNITNTIPMSMNNMVIKMALQYDLNERVMSEFVTELEDTKGTGLLRVALFDSSIIHIAPDVYEATGGIFGHQLSGYCLGYELGHANNARIHANVKMEMTDYSPLLAWSGDANLLEEIWTHFILGETYSKFDIVHTGTNDIKVNNFYYCTGEGHTATELNGPTGDDSLWTQDFFFQPDIGYSVNVELDNNRLDWKNSRIERSKTKDHIASFPLSYSFSNRSRAEAAAIMHYLDKKAGFRRFRLDLPLVFDAPKVMYAPKWEITPLYIDSYTLQVDLIEDPLGIIPTGT